jgi:hypothetical protein
MFCRPFQQGICRWLVGLSLAMYAAAGTFGHALHSILPCGDESCACLEHSGGHDGCCHHHDEPSASVASTHSEPGPAAARPGHDPQRCALCTLLAKISVGRLERCTVELALALVERNSPASAIVRPAERLLAGAPRGPPLI